jgi:anti-anti-sigma factor
VPETRPPQPFSATTAERDGAFTVLLSGELDMATAPDVALVFDALVDEGPHEIVLDLSALSFIDSSGIAVLVASQHKLIAQERHMALRGARPHAMRVFEIAGLVEFLNVQTEPEESTAH